MNKNLDTTEQRKECGMIGKRKVYVTFVKATETEKNMQIKALANLVTNEIKNNGRNA